MRPRRRRLQKLRRWRSRTASARWRIRARNHASKKLTRRKHEFRPLHDLVVVPRIERGAKTRDHHCGRLLQMAQEGEVVADGPAGRDEAGTHTD